MKKPAYNIGIFGTFDVQNYGDLLFPIIAEEELKKRLGSVNLYKFSYHKKQIPVWPFETTSLTELPALIGKLDGALIGGGHIIRFDKDVANDYNPPSPEIHHPTGYWLAPSLLAMQHGVPVMWNAPSLQNKIPNWADPLLKLILQYNYYTSVRDDLSKDMLSSFINAEHINVVPDTAFGISRLIDPEKPSAEFNQLRQQYGITDPYIVVQATHGLENFLSFLSKQEKFPFKDLQILALPIGPSLGDSNKILKDAHPGIICLSEWPHPLIIAELICHAAAVAGQSLHMSITASIFGVPIFSTAPIHQGKYKILSSFENLHILPEGGTINIDWFTVRMKKQKQSIKIRQSLDALDDHWDQIAGILQQEKLNAPNIFDQFWQSLPQILEHHETSTQAKHEQVKAKARQLTLKKEQLQEKEEQLKVIYNSNSWKVTAPLRRLISHWQKNKERK
jgi:lipopolysaccharide transport system ATP-binding protein